MATCIKKIDKLIDRLVVLKRSLDNHQDPRIHREIDKFFYVQKESELRLLRERLEGLMGEIQRMEKMIDTNYTLTYEQWRKDFKWLHRHLRKQSGGKPTL